MKKQISIIILVLATLVVVSGCAVRNQNNVKKEDINNKIKEGVGIVNDDLDITRKTDGFVSTEMKDSIINPVDYKDDEQWQSYNHDILGIRFNYPKSWGEPFTEPANEITDLKKIFDKYSGKSNGYESSIKIGFTKNDIAIRLINENSISPDNFDIYLSRPGNFKKISNICDLDSISSGTTVLEKVCHNGVFSVYGKKNANNLNYNLEYFSRDYSLIQLQNGFYDKALIIDGTAWLSNAYGTSTENVSFNDFLGAIGGKKEEYMKNLSFFTKFTNSVKSYKPKGYSILYNEIEKDENSDIATIKKYYNNILSGQFSEAYNMYKIKKVNFETFTSWYKNTIYAHAHDFKEIGDGKYRFLVDFQDHNSAPQKYRVTMIVDHGRIETVTSEELTSEKVNFSNMEVFTKNSRGFNSVVLSINNNELIVDSAHDDFMNYISDTFNFNSLAFSSQGNYLLYSANGWEWGFGRVYDVKNKSIIAKNELSTPSLFGVSKNEKYIYACAANDFGGEYYAKVFSLPNFSLLLNAYDNNLSYKNCIPNIECKISNDEVLMISLKSYGLNNEEKCNNERVIKFDLKNGKVVK